MSKTTCCPERYEWQLFRHRVYAAEQCGRMEGHLADCPHCREVLAGLSDPAVREQPPAPDRSEDVQDLRVTHDLLGRAGGPSAAPPARIGNYRVLAVLGRGGMGMVFKAFDEVLHRLVAVKGMALHLLEEPVHYQRFLREAKALAAVRNEHVVTIHGVLEHEGVPFLVMEYVEGVSLQERLDREGALPLEDVLRVGAETAWGLAAAHARGIVHRDVKPANILLEGPGQHVKLTDFGLARVTQDSALTKTGEVGGTPQYMAPEQAWGKLVDARSDLFSLGSVLYAMCTGRPPFEAPETLAVLRKVCDEEPPDPAKVNPEVPDWLADVIEKLQAKQPEDRFQSAEEVAELLQERLSRLQRSPSAAPRRASRWRNAVRGLTRGWRRVGLWKILLVALLAVAATVVAVPFILPPPPPLPGEEGGREFRRGDPGFGPPPHPWEQQQRPRRPPPPPRDF